MAPAPLRRLALLTLHAAVPLLLAGGARAAAAEPAYDVRMLPLPRTAPTGVAMDYIAFDPATKLVWAPAGNTGTVAVIDTERGTARAIEGFATTEITRGERKFIAGPSSATVGEGSVYVGNRGDSSVCAFDARSLGKGACHKLDSMPDGLAYVAATKEVWATTPRDKSIRVLDAGSLAEKAKITLEGSPEGFAVDDEHGRFYTNFEDRDRTVAIDLRSRKVVATWSPGCSAEGPRGLRVDAAHGWLFVACTARAEVLDAAHDGKVLSTIEVGEGIDDLGYLASSRTLYVPAAGAGQLVIAHVEDGGKLALVARVATHAGARNPAVTDRGVVYLAHSGGSGLNDLVVVEPRKGATR